MGILDTPGVSTRDPRVTNARKLVTSELVKRMVGAAAMSSPPTISQRSVGGGGTWFPSSYQSVVPGSAGYPVYGAPTFVNGATRLMGRLARKKFTFTANGSTTLTAVTGVIGTVANSNYLSGPGIPNGTQINSGAGTSTLTVSNAVAAGTNVTGYAFEGWSNSLLVAFDFDGAAFDVLLSNTVAASGFNGQFLRVWANEQPHSWTPTPVDASGNVFAKVDFGSRAPRRIVLELIGDATTNYPSFGDIRCAVTDSIRPSSLQGGRIGVIGDSYWFGIGASDLGNNMFHTLCRSLGVLDAFSLAIPSTGWAPPGNKFGHRVEEMIEAQPDAVLLPGTINDSFWYATNPGVIGPQITSAITTAIAQLKAGLPGVPIIVMGTVKVGNLDANDIAVTGLLRAAATAAGVPFVNDSVSPYLVGGSGWSATEGVAALARSGTGTTTNGSPTVTGYTGGALGPLQAVSGAGIPAGAIIGSAGVVGGSFTLRNAANNANVNATASGTVTITGGARPMGDGGADTSRAADSVHPSPSGHLWIARLLAAQVAPHLGVTP